MSAAICPALCAIIWCGLGHSCVTDGWLDDQALIADFDLTRLGRAAAKFDDAQLRHWQKEAVAHLSTEEFVEWIAARVAGGTG